MSKFYGVILAAIGAVTIPLLMDITFALFIIPVGIAYTAEVLAGRID